MHKQITSEEYQRGLKNFIGLIIDKVNVLYDPNLFVGGFSLVHVVDDQKKQGKILSFNGHLTYEKNDKKLETKIDFDKNAQEAEKFYLGANKIKDLITANSHRVVDIVFSDQNGRAVVTLSDGSRLIVIAESQNTKPLSYDDDAMGYSIHFGIEERGEDLHHYLKTSF